MSDTSVTYRTTPPLVKKDENFYYIGGIAYPRATRVLSVLSKPGLSVWRGQVGNVEANRIVRIAADLGNRVHLVCADINKGIPANLPLGSELYKFAKGYETWLNDYVEEVLHTKEEPHLGIEKLVLSKKYGYAGTTDLVARLRGDKTFSVIDIKTSMTPATEWPLQLSAYKLALQEEGIEIGRRLVVQLPKRNKICNVVMYEYDDHDKDEAAFRACLYLWGWEQDQKGRATQMRVRD